MNLIETKNLTKQYNKNTVVNNLSIKIPAGKLTAYLGTNGAGKSTTIRMLTKTLSASSGQIIYNKVIEDLKIGVVFQNSVLDTELSILDNLLLRGSMYKKITKNDILQLMNETGIASFSKKKYGQLSGGMRRKVDITRALINQPDILFLDEPTTGLDPQSRKDIWKLLNSWKQKGLAIFLTTHYLEEAEAADYIYILEKGSILEEGTSYDLKEKYNQPTLHLKTNNIAELKQQLASYIILKEDTFSIDIMIKNKENLIPLLNTIKNLITDFSYKPIDMTDVFLKITGRKI